MTNLPRARTSLRNAAYTVESYLPVLSSLSRLQRNFQFTRRRGHATHNALAIGAVAGAFMAIGALAIARLVIGKMRVGKLHLHQLEIDDLTVHRIHNGSGAAIREVEEEHHEGLVLPPQEVFTKEGLSPDASTGEDKRTKRSRSRKNGSTSEGPESSE